MGLHRNLRKERLLSIRRCLERRAAAGLQRSNSVAVNETDERPEARAEEPGRHGTTATAVDHARRIRNRRHGDAHASHDDRQSGNQPEPQR